jgi:hypothetical protein
MYKLSEKVYAISHHIEGDKIELVVVSGVITEVQESTVHNKKGSQTTRLYNIAWWYGEDKSAQFLDHLVFKTPQEVSEKVLEILDKYEKSKLKTK